MIRIKRLFFAIVIFQGLHSIEEYLGKIWLTFPPAEWLCSLFSKDLQRGFLIINIGLFIFGLLAVLFFDLMSRGIKKVLIFFWIIIEVINGIGHIAWSTGTFNYQPGLYTAPILLIFSLFLIRNTNTL